jgi:hypothetical protein
MKVHRLNEHNREKRDRKQDPEEEEEQLAAALSPEKLVREETENGYGSGLDRKAVDTML